MKQPLKGPHHFTGITRDVTTNVDFWCRVMGLRFVKNTLNFETTFRYHTYFGDEEGNPGSVVTFLEFNEAKPGVPGDGDIHRLVLRVASYDSLEYWMDRLIANNMHSEMLRLDPTQPQSLVFWDPENHEVELMVSDTPDAPLIADAEDIPAEHRIRGLEGARSFTTLEEMLPFAEHVGFRADGTRLVLDAERSGRWYFSEPPGRPSGDGRVGVWHHIAFDAGDNAEVQRARDEANEGVRPVDADLRPLLLRLVLLDVSRRADGNLHDGAWISARREARRPRRPSLSLASSGAASRQARSRADADRQPAPAVEAQGGQARAVDQRRPVRAGHGRLTWTSSTSSAGSCSRSSSGRTATGNSRSART